MIQQTNIQTAQSSTLLKKTLTKDLNQIRTQQLKKVVVTTLAGDGTAGLADGELLMAKFKSPLDVTITPDDTIYVADGFNSCVRKIKDGKVITFAGNGNANIKNGFGIEARFKIPCRVTSDIVGNLYLLDAADPRIRKITPAGTVSTYAGMNKVGLRNGDAEIAQFGQSFGIAIDIQRNVFIADSQNDCIRKISPNGQVITIAGTGKPGFLNGDIHTAQFYFLKGLVIDKQENLLVADFNRIRKVTSSGVVSTFAGNGIKRNPNESSAAVRLSQIEDMVIDEQENIYFTEANRIRKITPQGSISTIAGSVAGFEDGDAASAKFNEPKGLGIDTHGNLYVADSGNNRIRKISFI